jgi:hypothetical protein
MSNWQSVVLAMSLSLSGCGRLTREAAKDQIENYRRTEALQSCTLEPELAQKPEFRSLQGKSICQQTVDIQAVAITSEDTREVVFRVISEYDPAIIELWLTSFDRLRKRLHSIPFTATMDSEEPPQNIRQPGCHYWSYSLVDPEDGQTFQPESEYKDIWDCAVSMKLYTLYGHAATKQLAESYAHQLRLERSYQWQTFETERAVMIQRMQQPREAGTDMVAHFQRFDDGWRIIDIK